MNTKATTPKKGRPTPKQRKAATTSVVVDKASAAQTSAATGDVKRRNAIGLIAVTVAAFVHMVIFGLAIASSGGDTSVSVAALAIAPAITMLCVPYARHHSYRRWFAILGLSLTTYSDLLFPVLLVAEVWVLHRFWVVEGTPVKPGLFGRSTPTDPDAA